MEEQKLPGNNHRKKRAALAVAALAFLAGGIALLGYLHYKAYHISTDDAFIDGDVYTITSRVSGTVESVPVDDNQRVKEGDVLVELDPRDYALGVQQAEAALRSSRAKLKELQAKVQVARLTLKEAEGAKEAARADRELKQATLRKAEQDLRRAEALLKEEVLPRERYDSAVTACDVARADVTAASERLRQAGAALDAKRAVVAQAASEVESQHSKIAEQAVALAAARLSLSYTTITAPASGYVTRSGVEKGNRVSAGQPLMAVVDLDNVWITANYKETQVGKMKPGQSVVFEVDAWPDVQFKGTVQSIMAGSGSAFSVFPPENATGNYVKVVQRIPVKIMPEKGAFREHTPRVGMSVVPVVNVR
ncbi:MAG: HlyD family secretion protein [Nitrospirota bacterium]|jgi:membrane fusion protein (multidrug efflux system)